MLARRMQGSSGAFPSGILGTDTTPTNTNTPTFSGLSFGRPHPNRLLIVGLTWQDAAVDSSIGRTVTIGGVSATEVVFAAAALGGSGTAYAGIWQAVVPAGWSGDVVATVTGFSGTIDLWGCTLIGEVDLNSTTAIDTDWDARTNWVSTINPTGARFSVCAVADISGDLTSRVPYSSNGGSTLVEGSRTTRGLVFIDTTPPSASVDYSIDSPGSPAPDFTAAACWG